MAIAELTSSSQKDVKNALGKRESNNNYKAVNTLNYIGKYQFGAQALESVGYLKKGSYKGSNNATNDSANWIGPPGPSSKEDYLNNPRFQEVSMDKLMTQNYNTGVRLGAIKDGSSQGEISGFLSASHIAGAGAATRYVRSGADGNDAYGTSTSSYYSLGSRSVGGNASPGSPPPVSAADVAVQQGLTSVQANEQGISTLDFLRAEARDAPLTFNDDDRTIGSDRFDEVAGTQYSTSVFSKPFSPSPNLFQQFSTMTYSISLYLQSSKQYKKMIDTGLKSVEGLTLFIQSGGINTGTGSYGAIRSKYFDRDFYIDDFQFKSFVSGTSNMAPHNTFELNFTITEPAGITLFQNLHAMTHEVGATNYAAQQYLAVIRFYGYDENGKQLEGHLLQSTNEMLSDPTAVGEKYIPFIFKGITFRLTNDKVVYSCTAVCPQSLITKDKAHATVPSVFMLAGNTLDQVLNGNDGDGVMGLMEKMNFEAEQAANDILSSTPDRFVVEFEPGQGFEKHIVLPKDTEFLSTTGMSYNKDKTEQRFLNGRVKVNLGKKEFSVQAGTSVIKLIDVIIQTSTYITDQIKFITDSNSGDSHASDISKLTEKDFIWFKIRTEVYQIDWDDWRNDYAYEIKYVISRYKFASEIEYTKKKLDECFSIHKEYNFWFTGQNTEVLDFHQDYNYLWYSAISQVYNEESPRSSLENNWRSTHKRAIEYNSNGSSNFGANESTNISASIAASLYSPADQAMAKITIVGDPDFIAQSEIFYGPTQNLSDPEFKEAPFLKDGSINYDVSEVYFTINYNTIVDYDLFTGLANTIAENPGYDEATGQPGVSKYALVYRANIITTNLEKGKFTQVLEGTMKPIQPECTSRLELPQMERREKQDETSTTGQFAVNNNASDARLANTFNGGQGNDQSAFNKPKDVGVNPDTLSNPNSSGSDEGNVRGSHNPDFLEEYIHSDDNGYTIANQTPPQSSPPVDQFKDYVDPDVELALDEEGRNIFSKTFNTANKFTRQVWTDVEKLGSNLTITENNPFNEDDQ